VGLTATQGTPPTPVLVRHSLPKSCLAGRRGAETRTINTTRCLIVRQEPGQRRIVGPLPAGAEEFSHLQSAQAGSKAHPATHFYYPRNKVVGT